MAKNNDNKPSTDKFNTFLDQIGKSIASADNKYGKLPPYKGGQKAGNWLNDAIDKVVEIAFSKKK